MKVKIETDDGVKTITLDDSLCKTDEMLRDTLTPYYQGVAEAGIHRDNARGIITVNTSEDDEYRAEALEELLDGRQLLVAFSFLPGVKRKVQVTVNATNVQAEAARELMDFENVPLFASPIQKLIVAQLKKVSKPKAKAKAAGKK